MYIGIDLGGTGIKAGLVDDNYKILHTASVPTGAQRHYSEIIKDMAMLAIRVTEEAGFDIKKDVKSVGHRLAGNVRQRKRNSRLLEQHQL